MHANSILILSHTEASRAYVPSGMGEITNTAKLFKVMEEARISLHPIVDIYELFGGVETLYKPLALLNYELASAGEEIVEDISYDKARVVYEKIMENEPQAIFILSWLWSVAALMALGIQKKVPTITHLYAFHENEIVPTRLYEKSTLLITESLLANKKGIQYGIPSWKLFHLPPRYPQEIDTFRKNPVDRGVSKDTVVIGMVSRLTYGKNCEYALEAIEGLIEKGADILFVLKGTLDTTSPYVPYNEWLEKRLMSLQDKKWFRWEKTPSSFPAALSEYASFDICLHLSGAESGSNIVVEFLALGKPTLILKGGSNDALFKGGALFIENTGEMREALSPFRVPEKHDLASKLEMLIKDASLRKEWGEKAREIAQKRFCPELTKKRLPLLLDAARAFHENNHSSARLKKALEKQYEEDLKRYED